MNRSVALASAVLWAAAALNAAACAHATPQPPPPGPADTTAAQPDSPCPDGFEGALTGTGTERPLLICTGGTWQQLHDPYPSSDRWLTTGPELIVHGQGRRNPEAKAGSWTGLPQTAEAHCRVDSVDVVGAGRTSAPQTFTAGAGQPLHFEVSDHLFTVALSGFCLWQRE